MPARADRVSQFDADWLVHWLATQAQSSAALSVCVAWSGGADSTALLHALLQLRQSRAAAGLATLTVRAVHIDHGLQQAARLFSAHCRRWARRWRLPLRVLPVQVPLGPGISVEQAARQARYGALAQVLRPGEWLLTAQHADDQLETVLLQTLRGAGAAGLAGMAARAPLGKGWLLRPLLTLPRQSLLDYLQQQAVDWIDDPSNADLRFDRNYLRQSVLPPLLARWPAAARTVARAAKLAAEADACLAAQGHRDWLTAADGNDVDLQVLRRYSPVRQRALLRGWLLAQDCPVPDEQRLHALLALAQLRQDATPVVRWGTVQVRRHAGRLVWMAVPAEVPPRQPLHWHWQRQPRLALPGGAVLQLQRDSWGDVDLRCLPQRMQLQWRRGGERLLIGGLHRDVKSLLRESQLPGWLRDQAPLVVSADADVPARVLALADIAIADTIRASNASVQRGRFIWQQD